MGVFLINCFAASVGKQNMKNWYQTSGLASNYHCNIEADVSSVRVVQ